MKLPGINYRQNVEQLGRVNPEMNARTTNANVDLNARVARAHLQTAAAQTQALKDMASDRYKLSMQERNFESGMERARIDHEAQEDRRNLATTTSILQSAVQLGSSLYGSYAENKSKQQQVDAQVEFAKNMSQWEREAAATKQYAATDLPEGVYSGPQTWEDPASGEQFPVMVNSAEVMPELRKQTSEQYLQASLAKITDPVARQAMEAKGTMSIEAQYTKDWMARLTTQEERLGALNQAQFKAAMETGDYNAARVFNSGPGISEAQKVLNETAISKSMESDVYEQTLMSGDIEALKAQEAHLESEDYEGNLTTTERVQLSNATEAEIHRIEAARESGYKAIRDDMVDQTETMIDRVYSKGTVDPLQLSKFIETAESIPDFPEKKLQELKTAANSLPIIKEIQTKPLLQQEEIIREMRKEAEKTTSQIDDLQVQRFEKMHEDFRRDMKSDPLTALEERNLLKLNPFNPSDAEFWHERKLITSAVSDKYQQEVPPLTEAEAASLASTIKKGSPLEQVEVTKAIQHMLGPEASEKVFNQVGVEAPDTYALTYMDSKTGMKSLEGAKILEANKDLALSGEASTAFDEDFNEHFGTAFKNADPKMRSGMRQAAKNLYTYYANQEGDFSGEFDQERMDQVLKSFEIIEYTSDAGVFSREETRQFLAPEPGVTSESFQQKINSIPPKFFKDLPPAISGGSLEESHEVIMESIQEGAIKIEQTGRNEFVFIDTATNNPLRKTDGKVLKWSYGMLYE